MTLLPEMKRLRELARLYKQKGILPLIELKCQEVLNLLGRSEDVFVLTGEVMDQNIALEKAHRGQNGMVPYGVCAWQCEIACFMLDYERAVQHAELTHCLRKNRMNDMWIYTIFFYEAVASLSLAQESPMGRAKHCKVANRNLKKMRKLGRFAPRNFQHMISLVEAEFASLRGNRERAMNCYDKSIESSTNGKFLHHQALACERKSIALGRFGDKTGRLSMIAQARLLYEKWGAKVKLDQIDSMVNS